ncbi:hypothetical protein [Aliikangiella maris]|uniref:Uncharacterized protein n=2 Tax=Aliikangiella maris TaxID=3162458 RepID=A0ABV2C0B9_9GAMM
MEKYQCPKCGHKYDYPKTSLAGYTFWNCPGCGEEDGVHVSPSPELMFSEKELAEIERKKNTYCSLRILYSGSSDIPKFKKYNPDFNKIGNSELIRKLKHENGIFEDNVSVLEAEYIKGQAEECGLKVEIYA